MPSPIAHAAMAACIVELGRARLRPAATWRRLFWPVVVGLSFAPDADVLPVLWGQPMGRWHNHFTHSLVWTGFLIAAGAPFLRLAGVGRWRDAFLISAAAVGLHVAMDWLTGGRGLMLAWPFSSARFRSPILLFEGFHWSHVWNHPRHLVTLANEAAFAGAAAWFIVWRRRRERQRRPILFDNGGEFD